MKIYEGGQLLYKQLTIKNRKKKKKINNNTVVLRHKFS